MRPFLRVQIHGDMVPIGLLRGHTWKTLIGFYLPWLHPPVLSVPLVQAYPGIVQSKRVSHPISLIRLAPTLLFLVGLEGKGRLSPQYSMFKYQDELIGAAVCGFSDWATAVDTQFGEGEDGTVKKILVVG